MSNDPIQIKIGGTLLLAAQAVLDDATPIDITNVQLTSDVRDATPALIAVLTVTVTDAANGQFTLGCNDTAAWPPGLLFCDVLYEQNGQLIYSQTFRLLAVRSITMLPGA